MLNPELANNDVMYTAVDILPVICLVVPVNSTTIIYNVSHRLLQTNSIQYLRENNSEISLLKEK